VLRFNWIRPETTYYNRTGGMADVRPPEVSKAESFELMRRFPGYFEPAGKRNGHMQIRCNRKLAR